MRRYVPSFCAAAACAALLYGLSARFPNPLTRVLSPVNGSPWELGKLALIGGNLGFQFGDGFLFCHSA
mgnify:CR=1 FL=1